MKHKIFIIGVALSILKCSIIFSAQNNTDLLLVTQIEAQKIFPHKTDKTFNIAKSNENYCLFQGEDVKEPWKVSNVLMLAKKQLDNLKLADGDVFQLLFYNATLGTKSSKTSIKNHYTFKFIDTVDSQMKLVPTSAKIYEKCNLSVVKGSDKNSVIVRPSFADNQRIDMVCPDDDFIFTSIAKAMNQKIFSYIFFPERNIVAKISECTIMMPKEDHMSHDSAYDKGYGACALEIDSGELSVKCGSHRYNIQNDMSALSIMQDCCSKEEQFLLAVEAYNSDQVIKMNITEVINGSSYSKLNKPTNYRTAQAKFIDDVDKKNLRKSGLRDYLMYITGGCLILVTALLVYYGKISSIAFLS